MPLILSILVLISTSFGGQQAVKAGGDPAELPGPAAGPGPRRLASAPRLRGCGNGNGLRFHRPRCLLGEPRPTLLRWATPRRGGRPGQAAGGGGSQPVQERQGLPGRRHRRAHLLQRRGAGQGEPGLRPAGHDQRGRGPGHHHRPALPPRRLHRRGGGGGELRGRAGLRPLQRQRRGYPPHLPLHDRLLRGLLPRLLLQLVVHHRQRGGRVQRGRLRPGLHPHRQQRLLPQVRHRARHLRISQVRHLGRGELRQEPPQADQRARAQEPRLPGGHRGCEELHGGAQHPHDLGRPQRPDGGGVHGPDDERDHLSLSEHHRRHLDQPLPPHRAGGAVRPGGPHRHAPGRHRPGHPGLVHLQVRALRADGLRAPRPRQHLGRSEQPLPRRQQVLRLPLRRPAPDARVQRRHPAGREDTTSPWTRRR